MSHRMKVIPVLLVFAGAIGAGAATIKLRATSTGQYVAVSGSSVVLSGTAQAFTIVDANGQCMLHEDTISLRTSDGKFLGVDSAGNVVATATSAGTNEKFRIQGSNLEPGYLRQNQTVTLITATNTRLCVQNGAIRALCGAPVNEAMFQIALDPIPLSLTATAVAPPSPSKAGKAITLRANAQNGPAGNTTYTYKVTSNGTVLLTTDATSSYSQSFTPAAAGSYRLETTVIRTCNGVKVGEALAVVPDHRVAAVTFNSPAQGASVAPGATLNIAWSPVNISGPARLTLYNGTTRVADITPAGTTAAFESGAYSWQVPTTLSAMSQAKVLIQSTANTAMQWESAPFSMPAGTSTLAWTWTTKLTPAHFAALNLTTPLTQAQLDKLNTGAYSIRSILNSETDRLYDNSKCSSCHDGAPTQSAARYRPVVPVIKTVHNYVLKTDASPTSTYTWNNTAAQGVVNRFTASSMNKPEMLEKLFQKWLKEGGL